MKKHEILINFVNIWKLVIKMSTSRQLAFFYAAEISPEMENIITYKETFLVIKFKQILTFCWQLIKLARLISSITWNCVWHPQSIFAFNVSYVIARQFSTQQESKFIRLVIATFQVQVARNFRILCNFINDQEYLLQFQRVLWENV